MEAQKTLIESTFPYMEIIVAVLGVISTTLGIFIKIQNDTIVAIKNQLSERKYKVYSEIVSIYFDMLKQSKNPDKKIKDSDLSSRIIDIKKDLLLFLYHSY